MTDISTTPNASIGVNTVPRMASSFNSPAFLRSMLIIQTVIRAKMSAPTVNGSPMILVNYNSSHR